MERPRRLVVLVGATVAAALAGFVVTACLGVISASAASPIQPSGVRSGTLTAQDETYLGVAHQANLAEVDAGQAAQQRASSPVVRRLGAEFVADHSRLDSGVLTVATRLQVPLPELPNAAQRAQLAAVTAKTGAAFDTAWLTSQIAAHRQVLAAGRTEVARGSDDSVQALAQRAAPVVQAHLTALEQALGSSPPTGVNAGTGGQAARLPAGTVPVGRVLLGVAVLVVIASAVLFGPRRHRTA